MQNRNLKKTSVNKQLNDVHKNWYHNAWAIWIKEPSDLDDCSTQSNFIKCYFSVGFHQFSFMSSLQRCHNRYHRRKNVYLLNLCGNTSACERLWRSMTKEDENFETRHFMKTWKKKSLRNGMTLQYFPKRENKIRKATNSQRSETLTATLKVEDYLLPWGCAAVGLEVEWRGGTVSTRRLKIFN